MKIRIYSAPAAISIFGILGWLIAREKTRMVLFLQLWMNGTNILLDILCVFARMVVVAKRQPFIQKKLAELI